MGDERRRRRRKEMRTKGVNNEEEGEGWLESVHSEGNMCRDVEGGG